ncbi:MAG TPA: hypothetical protein VF902_10750 [Coriobacteriia bacterium]
MDGSTLGSGNAFLDWFQTTGQVFYILLQMVYWIVLGFAATFAAFQAKRYVDYKTGKTAAKAAAKGEAQGSTNEPDGVAVDEFVD